jgi:endo-1,3(4)-beta-glucanase
VVIAIVAFVALVGVVAVAATCSTVTGRPPEQGGGAGVTPEPDRETERVDDTLGAPAVSGSGSIAPEPPAGARPTKGPGQAGRGLKGKALPTNQWWSSALVGPPHQPLWARPVAVRVGAAGLEVSGAPPAASANAVVTPFEPAVTAGGKVSRVEVTGYGPLHVALTLGLANGGRVETVVTQGSPVVQLRFRGAAPVLTLAAGAAVVETPGLPGSLRVTVGKQRWDVVDASGGKWRQSGSVLQAADDGLVALARVPDEVDDTTWAAALAQVAPHPVVSSAATMAYDGGRGVVTQTLSVRREGGVAGLWALLPHQQAGLQGTGVHPLAGRFADSRGTLTLVSATAVKVSTDLPGLLPGVPTVPLASAGRSAVLAGLDADLDDQPGAGGSYFGLKELARLATIAEVAGAVGARDRRATALDRLRPQLVDWLTYDGPDDPRYFAYDDTWGGLIAVPAEFGSNDYNDHHFQYGYLVRAAAVLAAADPAFAKAYGRVVDLVVRDYLGGAGDASVTGLPPYRVFNAYLGHSAASGYALFADGNNQESSSEAVAAWEAVVRWGLVRGQPELVQAGVTRYAVEAATARSYWLGETPYERLAGYKHTVAGIVWDGKIDFATWFDAKPEAVFGIQLLPLTFGSLYRSNPDSARHRASELGAAVGGPPRIWRDLFAADLAVADPAQARSMLTDAPREPSTSRGLVRYWVEALAVLGAPQPAVRPDGPLGLAFGSASAPTLVGVNPGSAAATVTFRRGDDEIVRLDVPPGGTRLSD